MSEVAQPGVFFFFQAFTESLNLLYLFLENFCQAILNLMIRDLHIALPDLRLLQDICVGYISDHNDLCFLPVDFHLLFLQNNCAVNFFRRIFDVEHTWFHIEGLQHLGEC